MRSHAHMDGHKTTSTDAHIIPHSLELIGNICVQERLRKDAVVLRWEADEDVDNVDEHQIEAEGRQAEEEQPLVRTELAGVRQHVVEVEVFRLHFLFFFSTCLCLFLFFLFPPLVSSFSYPSSFSSHSSFLLFRHLLILLI